MKTPTQLPPPSPAQIVQLIGHELELARMQCRKGEQIAAMRDVERAEALVEGYLNQAYWRGVADARADAARERMRRRGQ